MKLTHTVTVKTHADNLTDTVEIYEDGHLFKVNLPAGAGRDRLLAVVSTLSFALWEKDL